MTPSHQSQELRNVFVILYAFHLRNSLDQGPDQVAQNASHIWKQLSQLGAILNVPDIQSLRERLICYQNGKYQPRCGDSQGLTQLYNLLKCGKETSKETSIDFQIPASPEGLQLEGSLSPYRIHDTYFVDFTISYPNPITVSQLHHLNPESYLFPSKIKASLGQTLLLSASLLQRPTSDQDLAKDCVTQILGSKLSVHPVAQGEILGNPIFQYDQNEEFPPHNRCHLLVYLRYKDLPGMEQASKQLPYILWYRHKILYAYHYSRRDNRNAKKLYAYLEKYARSFKEKAKSANNLETFRQLLIRLPDYAFKYNYFLRNLSDYETTIIANLENYRRRVAELEKLPETNVAFFKEFADRVENTFIRQIQTDQRYLAPGKDLIQQLIETIRGITEIEQAESDRLQEKIDKRREEELQLLIAFFGAGFAVSGISSQIIPDVLEKVQGKKPLEQPLEATKPPEPQPLDSLKLSGQNVLIHIGIGIGFGLVAVAFVLIVRWLHNKFSNPKSTVR